jgi:hypothetical protein
MLLINPYRFAAPRFISDDSDVVAYVLAVEAADGDRLEDGVISAYDSFITGCKTDSIWSALKASCILAGARTLSGALVPLVGSAPTNNNFVTGDYNRETGLVGNGSTKYLNSNKNNNSEPQNSQHLSVYISTVSINDRATIGTSVANGSSSIIARAGGLNRYNTRSRTTAVDGSANNSALNAGFVGINRSASASYIIRGNSTNTTRTRSSDSPQDQSIHVFAVNAAAIYAGRLSFYSIGESLDLAILDSRVSTLMTDLAAAIP